MELVQSDDSDDFIENDMESIEEEIYKKKKKK